MNSQNPALTALYRFSVVALLGFIGWKLHLLESKTRVTPVRADFVAAAGQADLLRKLSLAVPIMEVSGTVTVDGEVRVDGPVDLSEPVSVVIQR